MKRFQYTVKQINTSEYASVADREFGIYDLNKLGDLGWEMTGVVNYPDKNLMEFYFKRERIED